MTATIPDDLEIAPGITVCDWKNLTLDPKNPNTRDWDKAINIFENRIRCRFLTPVDRLIAFECDFTRKTSGFAILAIDFLVIETLEGFRQGMLDHKGESKQLFTSFLKRWEAFRKCMRETDHENCVKLIYEQYRCALHHSGQTDGAFRVRASGPLVVFNNNDEVTINRTCFHENLKLEFDRYLDQLREPKQEKLRCNFRKKMNALCGIKSPP